MKLNHEKKVSQKKSKTDVKEILTLIQKILVSKKCDEITILNLEDVNSYLSYFVICTALTNIQAQATARELERTFKHLKISKNSSANGQDSGWTLLDFGEILIHIMTPEKRNFYSLEKLWGDAKPVNIK